MNKRQIKSLINIYQDNCGDIHLKVGDICEGVTYYRGEGEWVFHFSSGPLFPDGPDTIYDCKSAKQALARAIKEVKVRMSYFSSLLICPKRIKSK